MLNRLKSLIIVVFLSWIASPLYAIDFSSVFYLGIEHGLSNNDVNCIYQSRNGYIWLGTFDGLNRYDGYNFKIFRKKIKDKNSLVNNRIQSIEEDNSGGLWIATMDGVSVFDMVKDRFTTLHFNPYGKKGIKRVENTLLLKKDSNHDILIGTVKDGLLLHASESGKTIQIPLVTPSGYKVSYQVSAINLDRENQVWLFVDGIGLCSYDREKRVVSIVNQVIKSASCIISDHSGNLWLGTPLGIYKYEVTKGGYTFTALPRPVMSFYFDGGTDLYVATDGRGLFVMDTRQGKLSHPVRAGGEELFTSTTVKGMLKDKNGRIWVATLRGGINVIDDKRYRFKTLTPDPLQKNKYRNYFISSFAEDVSGHIWIGTDGNGLNYWNRNNNTFINYTKDGGKGLSSNNITTIINDHKNKVWIATWGGGINRFNKTSGSFEQFICFNPIKKLEFKNVWNLYEDEEQTLWASTFDNGGLYRFNVLSNSFDLFDDTIGNVLCFSGDRKGNLWVGTDNKLIRIDRKLKKHLIFNIGYRVRSILEEKGNRLWLATEGGGLFLFELNTQKMTQFTESDGLPNNAVLNILRDNDGILWLSTFYGLSKFNPLNTKFDNFFVSDGLQSNQFSYLAATKLKSGELIFGGIKGFNLFSPRKIDFSKEKQQILLANIHIDNVPLSDGLNASYIKKGTAGSIEELVVPYAKASLSFEYISLEYSKPDKIVYAYFLEGWDNNWINAGKVRTANYSRLKEGNYTFHIKASNSEGEWGAEKIVRITVLPPWYRTWWAYGLYMFVVGMGIYLYSGYKREQMILAYKVRLAQIETRKEKELNEKKLSFFTNITHELRTPLTLIVNPVKELIEKTEDGLKRELNVIYRNAARLLTLVDQLMLFRTTEEETSKLQISEFNLSQLCRDIYDSYTKIAASKHISYEFECENKEIMIFGDYEKLEIVFFNLISNAFKFTPHNGRILFRVLDTDSGVEIFVNDTGCGIHEDVKNRLFEKYYQAKNNISKETGFGIGLYLAKLFIDAHEGLLHYSSSIDKGTSFQIRLNKGVWFDHSVYSPARKDKPPVKPEQLPEEQLREIPHIDPIAITEKKSMLIVDDHLELRQYLRNIFMDKFVIYEAKDGTEGLDLALKHMPDIVVSDVLMENGNGVELCKNIKGDPTLNHIPIILLSGLSSSESKLKGIESGADDYIVKPFEKVLLVAKINAILESRDNLHQYFQDSITLRNNNFKVSGAYKDFLEKCIAIVERNLNNEHFNAQELAKECNLSYSILYKKLKSISGLTLNVFIRSIRLRKAALLMLSTNTNVNEAAVQVGIYDIKFFRIQFKKLYGMNPSDYIKKYRGSFSKEFNLIKNN